MKCKNCGGELSFQNGNFICKSCGAIFAMDSIYEKIDVYICYEECDAAGRRTKDSIIAQEVYRKLEDNKISTFYERVSADGMTGSDLESSKLAAIHRASVIVVLGTSADAFKAIEAKYSGYFNGKPVIPFCVDVNPGAIPKTLSKIQAMNYSTIGWDRDLVKGICNILGRAPEVDTVSLYDRRKRTIIVFAAIMAVIIAIASMIAWIYLKPSETVEPSDASQSQETTEVTEKPLTQSDIYANAQDLLNSGKYLEAVIEFSKIAEYKDSSNQIKKIYDRYDGYYQDEDGIYSLYINVIDGKTIEFSFEKTVNYKTIKTEDSIVLENNCASGKYIDNLLNEGSISISLYDEYITLKVSTEIVSKDLFFGEIENKFELKNKSDRPPIKAVTKELLLSWVSTLTYVEDIKTSGYELEYIPAEGEIDDRFGAQYKISNTDIIVITTDNDLTKYEGEYLENSPKLDGYAVAAIIAPANLVCEDKIGGNAKVFSNDEIVFVPNTLSLMEIYDSEMRLFLNFMVDGTAETSNTTDSRTMKEMDINSNSMVGISSKTVLGEFYYSTLLSENRKIYYRTLILQQYQQDNPSASNNGRHRIKILAENKDIFLLCVHDLTKGSYIYYRFDATNERSVFITEHEDETYRYVVYGQSFTDYTYDKWKRYPELFGEFL